MKTFFKDHALSTTALRHKSLSNFQIEKCTVINKSFKYNRKLVAKQTRLRHKNTPNKRAIN